MDTHSLEQGRETFRVNEIDRLEALVQLRLNGRVREFRLVLRDNGLILQGRASTYFVKQLAQHWILQSGFPIVANEIVVS